MCHPQITDRNAGISQVVYGDCHFSSSMNDPFSSISICESKTVEEGNDLLYQVSYVRRTIGFTRTAYAVGGMPAPQFHRPIDKIWRRTAAINGNDIFSG